MKEKILLVDDEKEFLEIMAERMSARDMEVTTAASALEAIKLIENHAYDAVVLDLMMPEMDGLDALKAMKDKRPELQIILLTGYATVEKGIEAMKLGAMDLVQKPADLKSLTEKIKKARANKMIIVEKKAEEKIQSIITSKGW
ncbi:MAG: response regulator [Pseudomonadota bacterium]